MNLDTLQITLRILHIFGAVLWAGSVFFLDRFLGPAVLGSGPDGGKVLRNMVMRTRFMLAMPASGAITIITGFLLFAKDSMGVPGFAASATGIVYSVGALAGLLAGALGGHVNHRLGRKMFALGTAIDAAGGTATAAQQAEMTATVEALVRSSRQVAFLLAVALAAMAAARHVYL